MSPEGAPGGRSPARRGSWRDALCAALLAVALVVFVAGFVVVDGRSMAPTLQPGELLLATRADVWLHRLGVGGWRRGDVVHFTDPRARGPVGAQLVKRIVGLPGDRVALADGRLVLNGVPVIEAYLPGDGRVPGVDAAPTVVPPGHVFVLGDNRAPLASEDSRSFGPVPVARIWGRPALALWPPLERTPSGWRWRARRID